MSYTALGSTTQVNDTATAGTLVEALDRAAAAWLAAYRGFVEPRPDEQEQSATRVTAPSSRGR